jgi:hypothetical protein
MASGADPLLPYLIDTDTTRALLTEGFVRLPSVLSPEECDEALDKMWDFVNIVSGDVVSRKNPETWYDNGSGVDPWPYTTRWSSFQDMFQTHHAGFLLPNIRVLLAERVFEPLIFGTRQLHCSKEGFTFLRPAMCPKGLVDSRRRKVGGIFVCGKLQSHSVGEHFDQGARRVGLHHIQSSVAFLDQSPETGSFLCWPRSHRYHQELVSHTYRGRNDWVPLNDEELGALKKNGCEPCRVYAQKGDVILWRSDLVHAAAPPVCAETSCEHSGETRRLFRAVSYCGMLPAEMSNTPGILERKLTAYLELKTGDHKADEESWHDMDPSGVGNQKKMSVRQTERREPYYSNGPPLITWREAELHGLVPYNSGPDEQLRVMEKAIEKGLRLTDSATSSAGKKN